MLRPGAMRLLRFTCVVASAWGCAACTQREGARPSASSTDASRPAATPASRHSDWAPELGQVLVVPSDSEDAAVVLYPDEPTPRLFDAREATLVGVAGDTSRVRLVLADSQQCGDAPLVGITGVAQPTWSVGLIGQTARFLPMDSIESLSSADSARLAADLARLASALGTHRDSRFSGLPFAVLAAHRFSAEGRRYLVAHLARRLNQEAAPLEERTLLVAEAAAGEPYVAGYSERSEGTEESTQHYEVLAAVHTRQTVLLLIARDRLAETDYEVLERNAGGWRSRWSRRLAC